MAACTVSQGDRFGNLTVCVTFRARDGREVRWMCVCLCGCGRTCVTRVNRLTGENKIACRKGCAIRTHGLSGTPTYWSWQHMKARCYRKSCEDYAEYGARGITVCDRWIDSFGNFVLDMGQKPEGKTLDRTNVNGNYCPSNCAWATPKEQANNTRRNVLLTLEGDTKTATQWAEVTALSAKLIMKRKRRGWTDERILTTPPMHPKVSPLGR